MKFSSTQSKNLERLLIALFWIIFFAAPLLINNSEEGVNWREVQHNFVRNTPLLVAFFVHRLILAPRLFFQNRKPLYFASLFSLIAILCITTAQVKTMPFQDTPHVHSSDRPPPPRSSQAGPPNLERPKPPRPPFRNPVHNAAVMGFLGLLILGMDLGVQSARRLSLAEQEKSRLSTESIANELAFLRHQVSPHFFMNTLNNIHALIDLDQAKAKESVIQLSTMMRHLLHDTGIEQSTVQQELAFVQSYVDLMSLRFSDRVNITLRLPDPIPSHPLPSLLFTNLLENAFSYGISYEEASFIDIECQISDNKLIFIIVNSNFAPPRSESHMGIGLRNTQKRLHLLYPDDHTLDISDEDKTFRISLSIPL